MDPWEPGPGESTSHTLSGNPLAPYHLAHGAMTRVLPPHLLPNHLWAIGLIYKMEVKMAVTLVSYSDHHTNLAILNACLMAPQLTLITGNILSPDLNTS